MSRVAGADGCKAGWICVIRDLEDGGLEALLVEDANRLVTLASNWDALAVDIPIGLTERGRRTCDDEARQVLGWPRRNSVFPAPVRSALSARTREDASAITSRADGRRVGVQSWNIYAKIRSMDDALQRAPTSVRQRIREVHPEVCFWAWQGGAAMKHSKKRAEGRAARRRLVDRDYGNAAFDAVRGSFPKKHVADDDILDAFAALWTAERIARGAAKTLPESPPTDAAVLTMEIVY
jgi:predicted RNase H-like nuclease